MKTPITDAAVASDESVSWEGQVWIDPAIARRLELDRAALIEAMEEITDLVGRYSESSLSFGVVNSKAKSTLAAARANFPTP